MLLLTVPLTVPLTIPFIVVVGFVSKPICFVAVLLIVSMAPGFGVLAFFYFFCGHVVTACFARAIGTVGTSSTYLVHDYVTIELRPFAFFRGMFSSFPPPFPEGPRAFRQRGSGDIGGGQRRPDLRNAGICLCVPFYENVRYHGAPRPDFRYSKKACSIGPRASPTVDVVVLSRIPLVLRLIYRQIIWFRLTHMRQLQIQKKYTQHVCVHTYIRDAAHDTLQGHHVTDYKHSPEDNLSQFASQFDLFLVLVAANVLLASSSSYISLLPGDAVVSLPRSVDSIGHLDCLTG